MENFTQLLTASGITKFDLIAFACDLSDGFYLADDMGPMYLPEIETIPDALTIQTAMRVCGEMTRLGFKGLRIVEIKGGASRDVVIMARV